MKVFIIYIRYFDEISNKTVIGGLQTYIENLCQTIRNINVETCILQRSTCDFERHLENGAKVIGLKCNKSDFPCKLIHYAERIGDVNEDLLIFLTSTLIRNTRFRKTLAIQHGIYWDISTIYNLRISFPFDVIFRALQTIKEIMTIKSVSRFVCVDYNYINWLRSQTTSRNFNYTVIPNFSEESDLSARKTCSKTRIIFARRFNDLRGVYLVCDFMPKVLVKYKDIEFTIAGDGKLSNVLHETFDQFSNVKFVTYKPSESLDVHLESDIALVPSIGSEGTSLSLIEAMSAGCAVITTDVGGLSNLVLDGFNGRIVRPDSVDFYDAIKQLIERKELIRRYAENGRIVVQQSLSKHNWVSKWEGIIRDFI